MDLKGVFVLQIPQLLVDDNYFQEVVEHIENYTQSKKDGPILVLLDNHTATKQEKQ